MGMMAVAQVMNNWTRVDVVGDRPSARMLHSSCSVGDSTFAVFGGIDATTCTMFDDLWLYDQGNGRS
jgi:hypothetical protein